MENKIIEQEKMSSLDPLGIHGHWEWLGSSIAEWTLLVIGIVMLINKWWFGFGFMVFWIENLAFYILPRVKRI